MNVLFNFLSFFLFSFFCVVYAQAPGLVPASDNQVPDAMENIMYDSSVKTLEQAIYYTTQKHAIYSYNIANASTPEFEPIILPEDQTELLQMTPRNSKYFTKVLIEHMATNMARNKADHNAYVSLYKKKFEIYRQAATLGKK